MDHFPDDFIMVPYNDDNKNNRKYDSFLLKRGHSIYIRKDELQQFVMNILGLVIKSRLTFHDYILLLYVYYLIDIHF